VNPVVRAILVLYRLLCRIGTGTGQLVRELGAFLLRLLLPLLRPLGRWLLALGRAVFGNARAFAGTLAVLAAVFVAQGLAFGLLAAKGFDEVARYGAVGFALPAVLVAVVLQVRRRDGPAEGVRLRRLVGVALSVAVLADYFAGLTRLVPLIAATKLLSVPIYAGLVRLRLSDYASPTLAAMARGTLAFERLLFALVLFGLNAWMAGLEGREEGLALVLVAFYLPLIGTAETLLARTRRRGRFAAGLAVLGMTWCAVCYAAGGFAAVAWADHWLVAGALGIASTALASPGIWLYSGTWR